MANRDVPLTPGLLAQAAVFTGRIGLGCTGARGVRLYQILVVVFRLIDRGTPASLRSVWHSLESRQAPFRDVALPGIFID